MKVLTKTKLMLNPYPANRLAQLPCFLISLSRFVSQLFHKSGPQSLCTQALDEVIKRAFFDPVLLSKPPRKRLLSLEFKLVSCLVRRLLYKLGHSQNNKTITEKGSLNLQVRLNIP